MKTNRILFNSTALAVLAIASALFLAGCESPQQFADREARHSLARIRQECAGDRGCEAFRMQVEASRITSELEGRSRAGKAMGAAIAAQGSPYRASQPISIQPQRVRVCGLPADSGRYSC